MEKHTRTADAMQTKENINKISVIIEVPSLKELINIMDGSKEFRERDRDAMFSMMLSHDIIEMADTSGLGDQIVFTALVDAMVTYCTEYLCISEPEELEELLDIVQESGREHLRMLKAMASEPEEEYPEGYFQDDEYDDESDDLDDYDDEDEDRIDDIDEYPERLLDDDDGYETELRKDGQDDDYDDCDDCDECPCNGLRRHP
jgi:hypothetical protein